MITEDDLVIRGVLTRMIADLGYAPSLDALADEVARTAGETQAALRRLHDAHALLLHPDGKRPWVVHPFALSPGSCWVQTPNRGYWANCLYCGFGIAAALSCNAVITTRIGGEAETVAYRIADGRPQDTSDVFHLSTPVAAWWDNVIHACASFQPFHAEDEVDAWCDRHALPKGAVLPITGLWAFAKEWYGGYLTRPWRKRTAEEARALFARHGLTTPFWTI